ncbi:DUF4334 domain-containing protein [Saccharibacillus sp. JS10]|uniref:DUF4334 domain-containing protein n=1 Tax=Saccharibacillus sp. JS10 TaxID=2950552 RepID=UPI00210C60D4|nr:DUF4334 domain-containing protein [Saccharibacillus sp. JS10]MCQ4085455.1 DUF4334 domain-containing protein [Saccharibacillus sp. JS10]
MNFTKQRLNQMLNRFCSQEESFSFFDELDSVDMQEMWGLWKGEELNTGHPLEGLLTASGWYGKEFLDPENVHPLVFEKKNGNRYIVNPLLIPMNLPFQNIPTSMIRPAMTIMRPILQTRKSAARLRHIEYRGKQSASMVYDQKDIIDVFRKVDDDTLFAIMDIKSLDSDLTYFFVLNRVDTH